MSMQVSVVITVLNEADSLSEWIRSLAEQTMLPAELIVCDGGSTDGTADLIDDWAEKVPFPVTKIDRAGANISTGRNVAFSHARHEWVAVTDAGTVPHKNWLRELALQARPGVDVVAGFFRPSGSGKFERLLAVAITPRLEEIAADRFLPSSRSLLVRKAAWEKVVGYPEWLDYCEDLVFDLRLKDTGHVFVFAGGAVVEWTARSSLRDFFKQYYRYARGDGKADLWRRRHTLRYLAYAFGIVGVALARNWRPAFPLLTLGFTAYAWKYARRIARSEVLARREKVWGLVLLPVIIITGDAAKMMGYPVGVTWRRKHGELLS